MSAPGYTPTDSLVYLMTVAEILRDTALASLPDDHGQHSPDGELMHEVADKLHELAKAARHEAQAHGCVTVTRYSSGGQVATPGKVWHPLEVQL